jgi:two-component system OmpR family response regulator
VKILVIEDDQRIGQYLKKGLEMKGMVVDWFADGSEGFDMAAEEEYQVLVLDRMLPGMSGEEICRKLRQEKNSLPILMLTAKVETEDKVEGLDLGADDYLTKPFEFEELVARIKALARRKSKDLQMKVQVQDLSLDPQTMEVKRGQKIIDLSRKEFALLEFLMRRAGQVVNAQQIIENVWPFESDVLENTAQVYIGYLRKKIDKNLKINLN